MLFKPAYLVALLSLGPGSTCAETVQPDIHVVLILEAAFFPQKTTVKQGDVVRFVNESDQSSTVFHADGNWVTPRIASGEELLVTIGPDMTGVFYGMTSQRIVGQLDLERSGTANPDVR